MNFYEQQTEIQNRVKKGYEAFIAANNPTLSLPSEYVYDAPLDIDKYKKNVTFYFDFGKNSFNALSITSLLQNMNMTIYVVCRNGKDSDLKQQTMNYASTLFDYFQTCKGLDGLFDNIKIESVDFYRDEGLRATSLDLSLIVQEM